MPFCISHTASQLLAEREDQRANVMFGASIELAKQDKAELSALPESKR